MKKKIIFGVQDPGGTNSVLPVLKKLSAENSDELDLKILAARYSKKILEQNNLPFTDCDDCSLVTLDSIIENQKADIIVTGTSYNYSLEDKLVCVALERNIPIMAILDWWSNYWQRVSDLDSDERFKYMPDFVVVMDSLAKQEMVEEGFDENKLLVLGNPYFDTFLNKRNNEKTIPSDIMKILFVSSFVGDNFGGNEEATKEAFGYSDQGVFLDALNILNEIDSATNTFELTTRPHPKENQEHYVPAMSLNFEHRIDSETEPRQLISKNNIIIGTCSIMLFEAAMMGKTVISYQPSLKCKDYLISNRYGITKLITDREQFRTFIHNVLDGPYDHQVRSSIPDEICSTILDGKSTERVTESILSMIR